MKAEDTVIPKIIDVIYGNKVDITEELKGQAEISFKAGIKEVVDWIELVPTREIDGADQYTITLEQWQARLRKWGHNQYIGTAEKDNANRKV